MRIKRSKKSNVRLWDFELRQSPSRINDVAYLCLDLDPEDTYPSNAIPLPITLSFGPGKISFKNWGQLYSLDLRIKEADLRLALSNMKMVPGSEIIKDHPNLVVLQETEKRGIKRAQCTNLGADIKIHILEVFDIGMGGSGSMEKEKTEEQEKTRKIAMNELAIYRAGDRWRITPPSSKVLDGTYMSFESLCKVAVQSKDSKAVATISLKASPADFCTLTHHNETFLSKFFEPNEKWMLTQLSRKIDDNHPAYDKKVMSKLDLREPITIAEATATLQRCNEGKR